MKTACVISRDCDFARLLNYRLQVVVLDGYLIKIQQAGRNMHNGG